MTTSHSSGLTNDQTEWYQALRLHQDLLRLHGVDLAFIAQNSQSDDVTSDDSGESTTCDSGRGGSEEDSQSHGRQSPVKDGSNMNNLSDSDLASRSPTLTKATNIPRSDLSHLTPRQVGFLLDTKLPSKLTIRSSGVTVKHVSFREDFRNELSELLPANSGIQNFIPNIGGERWKSSTAFRPGVEHNLGCDELRLTLDQSFDTVDDGDSTTTSGSYTVNDMSPWDSNTDSIPEQASV